MHAQRPDDWQDHPENFGPDGPGHPENFGPGGPGNPGGPDGPGGPYEPLGGQGQGPGRTDPRQWDGSPDPRPLDQRGDDESPLIRYRAVWIVLITLITLLVSWQLLQLAFSMGF